MEKLKGRWEEPKSKALMVGSYVDSYFEGTLDKFKAVNSQGIFPYVPQKSLNCDTLIYSSFASWL